MRELRHVFLVIPLGLLLLGRLAECHDAVVFLVHVTGYPANGAALARGIPALEQDDHAPLRLFEVLLYLQQLSLERLELFLAPVALDGLLVPGLQAGILFCQLLMFLHVVL